jgi:hypothetical protein
MNPVALYGFGALALILIGLVAAIFTLPRRASTPDYPSENGDGEDR